jgi:hypothetical protein
MGGCGSGRPKTRDRILVEDCHSIDINEIAKYGWVLYPILGEIENVAGKEYLSIYYDKYWLGERLDLIEHIELEKTYPYFGGERYWMKCPGCGKRVRKIYSPPHKTHFRCRICQDLFYRSQESNVYDGWLRKIAKMHGLTPKKYEKVYFGHK